MNTLEAVSWRAAVIGRWMALIAGTLLFLFFVAFFYGEGPPDLSRLTLGERLQALCVAILFSGLPVAWKWEGLSGLLSVAGFGFLASMSTTNVHRWVFSLPALTGAAHLARLGAA